ncbi:MAG TPA: CvpA family protein [Chitinophagaceae bacterium]
MNLIDILLIFIVLISVLTGWRRGFLLGLLQLAGWIASILAALYFYRPAAELIERYTTAFGAWSLPIAFLAILVFVRLLFSVVTRFALRPVHPDTHGHLANKALGVIPGFINGVINATIVAALLLSLPVSDDITNKTRESKIGGRLAGHVEWIDEKLSPVFDEAINRSINKLTVRPESNETVKLKFTVANPSVRADLEARMLVLVNEERIKYGLQPLQADPELAEVARNHSRDMFARGYFSHKNPEGKAPGDRIRESGVKFLVAGENLALGQTLKICHNGLMNSPGHRANILHASYGRLGIGVLDGGIYGLMITQNFRN